MRLTPLTITVLLTLSSCTFVRMAPGADAVRVAAPGEVLANCQKRGEVVVSVKNRLGPYERDALRVRDELETLARNEAPGLHADTVRPSGEPRDGEQRFSAFRCVGAPAHGDATAHDDAEITPLKD